MGDLKDADPSGREDSSAGRDLDDASDDNAANLPRSENGGITPPESSLSATTYVHASTQSNPLTPLKDTNDTPTLHPPHSPSHTHHNESASKSTTTSPNPHREHNVTISLPVKSSSNDSNENKFGDGSSTEDPDVDVNTAAALLMLNQSPPINALDSTRKPAGVKRMSVLDLLT